MSRARTPFGAVPISTIYGFDYPLSNGTTRDFSEHAKLSESVDHMVRKSRAMSENRVMDPYYSSISCSGLSFMPMALRASRSITPIRDPTPLREPSPARYTAPPPPVRSERVKEGKKSMTSHAPRQSAIHQLLLGILQDSIIHQDTHSHTEGQPRPTTTPMREGIR